MSTDILTEKWAPVINHDDLDPITDREKKAVIAQVLENTETAIREEAMLSEASISGAQFGGAFSGSGDNATINGTGRAGYDPIIISLVRRAMPQMMAFDLCGVQPMSAPTGLIFALRARYGDNNPTMAEGTTPYGMTTRQGEGDNFREMSFTIERTAVEAKTRALKSEYTMELVQDLKAVHGLDAEAELANILSTEILAEINREVVRTMISQAKLGGQGLTTTGIFDLIADGQGRWSVERQKGLMLHIEKEANQIAFETRRGKGNFILCSANVASALTMAGLLDYSSGLQDNLNVDTTSGVFAGTLNGRTKVYIDPYATAGDYVVVGYKGSNNMDAGMFYCPYVPLQMVRAVAQETFQPKIGFKTRYGMVSNPFANPGGIQTQGLTAPNTNVYYRKMKIENL